MSKAALHMQRLWQKNGAVRIDIPEIRNSRRREREKGPEEEEDCQVHAGGLLMKATCIIRMLHPPALPSFRPESNAKKRKLTRDRREKPNGKRLHWPAVLTSSLQF
jgi:hypothetical protein